MSRFSSPLWEKVLISNQGSHISACTLPLSHNPLLLCVEKMDFFICLQHKCKMRCLLGLPKSTSEITYEYMLQYSNIDTKISPRKPTRDYIKKQKAFLKFFSNDHSLQA